MQKALYTSAGAEQRAVDSEERRLALAHTLYALSLAAAPPDAVALCGRGAQVARPACEALALAPTPPRLLVAAASCRRSTMAGQG
jgi:hypothetical protein